MAKKMRLVVEKELALGKSGITIYIRDAKDAVIGRLQINQAAFRFYEKNKGRENLTLRIDDLLDLLRSHHAYKH